MSTHIYIIIERERDCVSGSSPRHQGSTALPTEPSAPGRTMPRFQPWK